MGMGKMEQPQTMSLGTWIDGILGITWRTVGHHACLLDSDGHILRGGPPEWLGVHVSRLREHAQEVNEIKAAPCTTDPDDLHRATFPNKAIPVAALLEANPALVERMDAEDGSMGKRYREWLDSNQNGHKPMIPEADGRFDAINEAQDRRGPRRVCCWLEACYASMPANRRWDDIDLTALEEAHGAPLQLPAPAELRAMAKAGKAECLQRIEDAIEDAKKRHREKLEEAPF